MARAFVEGLGWVEQQTKAVDITENGTTEITPDRGMVLNSVMVNTNVPQNDINLDEYIKKTEANDSFVAKVTKGGLLRVYGIDGVGNQTTFDVVSNASLIREGRIPRYVANTAQSVMGDDTMTLSTGIPTQYHHATNKKYVDDIVADLVARIEALEELGLEVTINISDELGNPIELKLVRGMTWGEWIGSSYNTGGFQHDGTNVFYGGSLVIDFSTGYNASPHDIIKTSAGNYYCSSV